MELCGDPKDCVGCGACTSNHESDDLDVLKFLGTTHNGKFKLYLKSDGYVYQENEFGREVGWLCSWTKFDAFRKTLDTPNVTCELRGIYALGVKIVRFTA